MNNSKYRHMRSHPLKCGDRMAKGCWTSFKFDYREEYIWCAGDIGVLSMFGSVIVPDNGFDTSYKQTAHQSWTPDCGISRRKSWGSHTRPSIYKNHSMRAEFKHYVSWCDSKKNSQQYQDLKSQISVPPRNSNKKQQEAMANKIRVRKLNSEKKAIVDKARADARTKTLATKVVMTTIEMTQVDITPVETTTVETNEVETTRVNTTDIVDTDFCIEFRMTKPVKS